jgi:hypothetical protein
VIAFTTVDSEFFVPYAVDLGVKIIPAATKRTELAAIQFGKDDYLQQDSYDIQQMDYLIENRNPEAISLVIEQRIRYNYELFDTMTPFAQTAEFYRWRQRVPARSIVEFHTQERKTISQFKKIGSLTYHTLFEYLKGKFIDQAFYNRLKAILDLYQQLNQNQNQISQRTQQREKLATELLSAAEKLKPLGKDGAEGELRKRYVAKMQEMEDTTDHLAQEIAQLEVVNSQLQQGIQTQLQTFTTSN